VTNLYRVGKPLEAHQWLPDNEGTPSANRVADWLNAHEVDWTTEGIGRHCVIVFTDLKGRSNRVERGDWIIKGLTGMFFPCDPTAFAEIYVEAQ
jgi:hypothetical protein